MLRRFAFGLLAAILLAGGAYGLWYFNRPLPEAVNTTAIFEGITYRREVRSVPRRTIVHVVTINLDAPGIRFLVTPGNGFDGFDYRARTVSQFVQEFGLQVAINGDFFDPWRDYGPWDYYPHEGDGVNARGLTISQGQTVTDGYAPPEDFATLFITDDNRVSFEEPEDAYNAISGIFVLKDGRYSAAWGDNSYIQQPHPRTAVAIDETRQQLIIVVVDGRQPNYSEGVTLPELGEIILANSGYHALNLDGGGSSALVIQGDNGQPLQLGSAIHTRIPARERPIANHLGVYAISSGR